MKRGQCSITYREEPDDEKPSHKFLGFKTANELTVVTQSTPGGGNYVIIKTNRWCLDEHDIPWFVEQIRNALKQDIPL